MTPKSKYKELENNAVLKALENNAVLKALATYDEPKRLRKVTKYDPNIFFLVSGMLLVLFGNVMFAFLSVYYGPLMSICHPLVVILFISGSVLLLFALERETYYEEIV